MALEEPEGSSRSRRLSERRRRASDAGALDALKKTSSGSSPKKGKSLVDEEEAGEEPADEDIQMELPTSQPEEASPTKARRKKKNVEIDSGVGLEESETATASQENDGEDAYRIPDAMDVVDDALDVTKLKKKKRRHRRTKRPDGEVEEAKVVVEEEKPVAGPGPDPADEPTATTPPETQAKDRPRKKKEKQKDLADAANEPEGGNKETAVDSGIDCRVWEWISLADPSHQTTPPVFSKDGKYYFSISSSSVKVHSADTGLVLSTLSPPAGFRKSKVGSHTRRITSACINPENAFQLLTASLDGTIKIWDYVDAALLRTIDFGRPITQMAILSGTEAVVVSKKEKEHKDQTAKPSSFTLSRISLQPPPSLTKPYHPPTKTTMIGKQRFLTAMAISPNKDWLVTLESDKVLTYPLLPPPSNIGPRIYTSPEALTCIAFHPTENYFATGDAVGQIRLWYCLQNLSQVTGSNKQVQRSQTKVMHWHAHAVASVAFTPNGAYLISGGEEAVLVVWELAGGGFKKEFVPRLGGAIEWLSTTLHQGVLEYVLGLEDGTTLFVNAATLKLTKSFSGLKINPRAYSRANRLPLAYHEPSQTVILPSSHPSSIQMYSPSTSRLVSELEVSPSNRISRRDDEAIEFAHVELVRTDDSGRWMATVDWRSEATGRKGSPEVYLKIWEWASGEWRLNSRFDDPHGESPVRDLVFRPKSGVLVSAGEDGKVRKWRLLKGKEGDYWELDGTFDSRSGHPSQLAFSADGSLLAVGQGACVTLHTEDMGVVETISCSEFRDVTHLSFVGSKGRYIAVASLRDVVVWDILSATVKWRFSSPHLIVHLLPHLTDETFVVLHHPWVDDNPEKPYTGAVFFRADGPSGIPYATRSLPYRLKIVNSVPQSSTQTKGLGFSIVAISESWKILLCGDQPHRMVGGLVDSKSERNLTTLPALRRTTLFEDIFGKSAFFDTKADFAAQEMTVHENAVPQNASLHLFQSPPHLLSSIESLYDEAITGFLQPRPAAPTRSIEIEDVKMADVEVGPSIPVPSFRQITNEEVISLIDLFRSMPLPTPSSTSKPSTAVNGVSTRRHLNGVLSKSSSKASLANGKPPPPTEEGSEGSDSDSDSSSSPVPPIGTKRKSKTS